MPLAKDASSAGAAFEPEGQAARWLALQREGWAAGGSQSLPPQADSESRQRLLQSFKLPIPARFEEPESSH